MESLLKYFEAKHDFRNVITFDTKLSRDVIQHVSISKVPMIQVFFNTVLEYYYRHDIPLEYTDTSISSTQKANLIKKVESFSVIYEEKGKQMFDLIDFIFKIFKKFLDRCRNGFEKWILESPAPLKFETVLLPNIDVCLYILFLQVFPEELKDKLRTELHISDLEHRILNRCHGIIVKNSLKICNLKRKESPVSSSPVSTSDIHIDDVKEDDDNMGLFDFLKLPSYVKKTRESISEYNIDTYEGITMLLLLFNDLRPFNLRRRSKTL